MEGLEISEVFLKEVFNNETSCRIDSEFYKKSILLSEGLIQKYTFDKLVNLTQKIDVGFVSTMTPYYRDDGVTLLQTKNIAPFLLSNNVSTKICENFHKKLKKSQVHFEDILVARSGSFGKAAIYLEKKIINSADIIMIRVDKHAINPYFLTTYLNTSFGANQMVKFASGGVQGHVNLTILENLKIPQLNKEFQTYIEKTIIRASNHTNQAKISYKQAEKIILETLGLKDFKHSQEKTNIKSFSESFSTTGRLDAEYYQLKYEDIINHIKSAKFDKLINLAGIQKSIEPGSDAYSEDESGLPFLRVADYNKFGVNPARIKLKEQFVQENKAKLTRLKPKKNSILFSKDGTVGLAYCMTQDADFITSGAILNLTVKNTEIILPEYLTLVLNSLLVQMQAERDAGGSIILHWRTSEIENILIPIVDIKIQLKIVELIQESFSLKTKSERLLEVAKRAVEIAIEQDEDIAIKYIEGETESA